MRWVSRRSFALGAVVSAVAGAAFGQSINPPPGSRIRKDVATLSKNDDNLVAFRDAYKKMSVGSGPLSWRRQVEIHAGRHRQHGSWLFLPWHRAQLHYFERIVRKVSGHDGFALPYLNWDNDTIPDLFLDPSDALWHPGRRPFTSKDSISDFGAGVQMQFRDLSRGQSDGFHDLFGRKDLNGKDYGGLAEQFGHNLVHVFVGGDMGVIATAPNDPLFFFHHANADRLWARWSHNWHRQNGSPDPRWLKETVSGYVDETGADVDKVQVSTLLSTEALGYSYGSYAMNVGSPGPNFAKPVPDDIETLSFERIGRDRMALRLPRALVERRRRVTDELDAPIYLDLDGAPMQALRAVISIHDGAKAEPIDSDLFFMAPLGHQHGHGYGYSYQASQMVADAAQQTLEPRLVVRLERIDPSDTMPLPVITACRLGYASTQAKVRRGPG